MRSYLADQVHAKGERICALAQSVGQPSRLDVVTESHTKSWNKGWGKYGKA